MALKNWLEFVAPPALMNWNEFVIVNPATEVQLVLLKEFVPDVIM